MYTDGTIKLRFDKIEILSTKLGEEFCVPDLLGEDSNQNNTEFCLDEEEEIYEGYGRLKTVYPYRKFKQYNSSRHTRNIQIIVLENRYLKATFLPEYGGRLWLLIDKVTGRNLLYTNDELQFCNQSVRNVRLCGGVEWNVGVLEHTPFATAPLYVAELENERGNSVLRMYEYERIRKVCFQMDFWLNEKDRALNCRMRIVNDNDVVVPMCWWSNIAVPKYEDGRVIVPATNAYTVDNYQLIKVQMPHRNGVNTTRYFNIPESGDFYFDLDGKEGYYIKNLDKDGFGLLQMSTERLKGRKLSGWGKDPAAGGGKEAGDYLEIQAGLGKTQYGCLPMAPHTAWEWMEQYGAARLTGDEIKDNILQMEETLKYTKHLAKTRGKLISEGSGYGFFAYHKNASHLEFVVKDERLKKWERFLKTGKLYVPAPLNKTVEFPAVEEIVQLLEKTIQTTNKNNWYAHYQLGVWYCTKKEYELAENELLDSYCLAMNPWACYMLACLYFFQNKTEEVIFWSRKGLLLIKANVSYLEEVVRLIYLSKEYKEVVRVFENLGRKGQKISQLRLYYAAAKYELGEKEEL